MKRIVLFFCWVLPQLIFGQWQKINVPTNANFRALKVSGNHLWAGGTKGTILHAEGDINTIRVIQVPGAAGLDFRDVAILPDQQVLAMSAGPSEKGAAVIYYSNDLGKTWLKVFELTEPGYFFDAILFDTKSNKGYLLSDPIDQQLTLFEFNLNLEFQKITIQNSPQMLPKEAFFAASGSSMLIHKDQLYLITGGSEYARIWRSKDLKAQDWEIMHEQVEAGPNRGFFSINCSSKECMVAGGDYTKINQHTIPILIGSGKSFSELGSNPGFYIEKVLSVGKDWYAAGPAGLSKYSYKTKQWAKLSDVPLHNIAKFGNKLVGVGKEMWVFD